jgi:hypothetical protein
MIEASKDTEARLFGAAFKLRPDAAMSPYAGVSGSNLAHLRLAPYRLSSLASLVAYDFSSVLDALATIHIGWAN